MRKKKLIWQLFSTYLVVICVSLLAGGWYTSRFLRSFYYEQVLTDLAARARLIAHHLSDHLTEEEAALLDRECKILGKSTSTRVTIIIPSGKVLGDSESDPAAMDNHGDRPEIKQAMAGLVGTSIRYSATIKENLMYLTLPVNPRGSIIGVVRAAVPVTSVDRAMRALQRKIALGGLTLACIAAMASLVISRRISRPLEEMKEGAERFAEGELGFKLSVPNSEEIGRLAETMNEMASQLNDRIRAEVEQKNEREAILASMEEGVLAVDEEERIISANRAAGKLLGARVREFQGRGVREILRSTELQVFISRTLESPESLESEIALQFDEVRFLHIRGAPLRDAGGRRIGAVMVLADVTGLRRLEKMRQDFVANISHEIRTPITSIKASVEALMERDCRIPDEGARFLKIISRQADRLNAVFSDLLTLSRLEGLEERGQVPLEKGDLRDVIHAAVQDCESKTPMCRITPSCESPVIGKINPPLLEQAIVNLLDNAIKYSEPGAEIRIAVERTEEEIQIRVMDRGCGIEKRHLSRIFERFYRIDRSRSRKLGGTGLGLAIVKHIALIHGGLVSVESAPGQGSTFTIHLPLSI